MASVHGAHPGGAQELFEPAWQMRWRVPELALMLGDQAVAEARRIGDRALRLRAEAVALFASNRLGHGVAITQRAISAVRDAERAGDHEIAAELRVELACCARTAGGHEVALRVLQPVLERERIEPALRAHALLELAAALPGKQRESERAEALDEADRLYAAASELNRDTSRLLLARVRTARAGHLRRNGDFEQAARAAEEGLALLDRLGDPAAESGEIRARLVLERVHSLLDLGRRTEAVEAASPVIRTPVRAAAAGPSGWLRLALATRVHLPAGDLAAAVRLLNDAAANAERHKLDCLLTESLSMSSQTHEKAEEFVEALATLRRAYAADRRWRAAVHAARVRLLEEFPALATGTGPPPAAPGPAGTTTAAPEAAAPLPVAAPPLTTSADVPARAPAESFGSTGTTVAESSGADAPAAGSGRRAHSAEPAVAGAHDVAAEAPQQQETAGRRRADGTGRPQRTTGSPFAANSGFSPPPEPAEPVPAPDPPNERPAAEATPEVPTGAANRIAPEDPLDEYRKPGESSVRDAARRLMDTLTSRVADDRRTHQDQGEQRRDPGPLGAMPAPRAPEPEAAGTGGKRRAPEPEEPAAEDSGRHGGMDVPVGRVTSAPFGEGFPVYDFGSRSGPAIPEPEPEGARTAEPDDAPAPRTRGSRRREDVAEPPPTEVSAPWDRGAPGEPSFPDVTAIMPVISVPDHEPPPTSQVGAVEHLDEDRAEPDADAAPGTHEEGGRRSRGRTLAEIRESLAEMQRHGREDGARSRRAAPEPADAGGYEESLPEDPPRSGASWADRYLGAFLDERGSAGEGGSGGQHTGDRHTGSTGTAGASEETSGSGGRRRARHADPDDRFGGTAPDPPRWDAAPWDRPSSAHAAPDPLGPQGTVESADGLPPTLGMLSEPTGTTSYPGGGEPEVSPFDRTRPDFGPVHGASESDDQPFAAPGGTAADRLESAAELLARHQDGSTQAAEEPAGEVGLADLLAEALLAYENGRRQDDDGPGRHGRPGTNGHPIGLPHQHEAEPDPDARPRHRRPAQDTWTPRY
ncbi:MULTISPECIES: hypothetical protein [unclassified Saccharopolyspora]|uniref:hypothetical protein n=1 Tax=unclassified Saccharopolyspora TaxID=2646250 RepID=UPI001CD63690|nr:MULTISPECIES: hypothetical protein [unclassified Saccharopolyspora]MCA1192649.1 hypothetical protein [Saccharopolyspora sp. 6V]MCA1227749.1 hypothetical protein [Saccharopolyspora sp. 6M]MCA1281801.1 hypothetical protein [Saccharopolyspora sp. 7B]